MIYFYIPLGLLILSVINFTLTVIYRKKWMLILGGTLSTLFSVSVLYLVWVVVEYYDSVLNNILIRLQSV